MKKYFLIVFMLLSFLGGSATAQTIEESNALYKEFSKLCCAEKIGKDKRCLRTGS